MDFDTNNLSGESKKVADIVNSVMGEDAYGGGCKAYYTPDEWRERGESYGTESVLILVHDGSDLASYCNIDYGCVSRIEKLRIALEKNGYYVENCTGWYSAVYRIYKGALADSLWYG